MESNNNEEVKWTKDGVRMDLKIGEGSYGRVYEVINKKNDAKAAMKIIKRMSSVDQKGLIEANLMRKANETCHQNIAKFYHHEATTDFSYIFMELYDYSLDDFIADPDIVPTNDINQRSISFMRQILSGVAELHKLHLVHRDMKPGNCLVDGNLCVKIGDFGLAKIYTIDGEEEQYSLPVGSPNFFAPEMLADQPYRGPPADVFACGVIFFQLMTGELPWPLPLKKERNFASFITKSTENENWNDLISKFDKLSLGYEDFVKKEIDDRLVVVHSIFSILLLVIYSSSFFFLLVYIHYMRLRQHLASPHSPQQFFKIKLAQLLIADAFAMFTIAIIQSFVEGFPPAVVFVYPLALLFAMIVMCALHVACGIHSVPTSGGLFLSWLTYTICGIPELMYWFNKLFDDYSDWHWLDTPRCICYIIWFMSCLGETYVNCFADKVYPEKFPFLKNPSPELCSLFFNRVPMWSFNGLCFLGFQKPLEVDDLYGLNEKDMANHLANRFKNMFGAKERAMNTIVYPPGWERKQESGSFSNPPQPSDQTPLLSSTPGYGSLPSQPEKARSPSVIWTLFLLFKWDIVIAMMVKLLSDILLFRNPILLKSLIRFTEQLEIPMWQGVGIAFVMFVSAELSSLLLSHYFYLMYRVGTRVQTCLTHKVYTKTLKLSSAARRERTVGEIVNLMAIDVDRFQQINQIGKDIETVDILLAFNVQFLAQCLLQVVSTLFIIMISTPLFGILVIPLAAIYLWVMKYFIATSRQMKRLESVTRSPIFSHLSESIQGSTTVRALKWQEKFTKALERKIDTYIQCRYLNYVANRWLSVRLEFIGNIIVLCSAMLAVINRDTTTSGVIGLSVSYALNITTVLNFAVRQITKLETNIVSVERINEYSETEIDADSARYREGLNLVVKQLNVEIKPHEKIGIVGRSGAGKSSVTLSLFRISEAADKLEYMITEGGDNISVGQRQLVCLARALLRKTRVLVLDEATAAVDHSTDALIQKTIREEFANSTVLTIAHRLNTILDYDRIIVLHDGKIAELDSPQNLLKNHKSLFFSMAEQAGLV